jgi:LysM repeat protein
MRCDRDAAVRGVMIVVSVTLLVACTLPPPPASTTPRPTALAVLEITPAPTQDVEATATVLARQLAVTPTPAGLYIVEPGDTLSALAEEFGTTVAEIMAANGLTDPNAIQVGQALIIPSLVQSAPAFATLPPETASSLPADVTATAPVTGTATTPAPTLATP